MRRSLLLCLLLLAGCRQAPLPTTPVAPPSSGHVEALPPAGQPDAKAHVRELWQKGADAKHAGDTAAARVAWRAALDADPGNAGIKRALAELDKPVTPAAAPSEHRHGTHSSGSEEPGRYHDEPAASPPDEAASAPPAPEPSAATAGGGETVYVTNTGHKYHSGGCRYLRQSSHPMTRQQAEAAGYTACSVCGG